MRPAAKAAAPEMLLQCNVTEASVREANDSCDARPMVRNAGGICSPKW